MVSHHVFSQLILFALLWLVVILHLTRPKRPVTAPATLTEEPEPLKPKRHRSNAPQPFEGLTHKPHCALCERDTASPQAPLAVPPDPMPPTNRRPVRSTPVVPEYPLRRKSLIPPLEGSTLDGTIGQQKLSFAMESPKPCKELTGMERRPLAWMTELVEGVAGCMEAHSPIGALGWRYHEEEELLELSVYPTPVKLVGGEHDGAIVMPGFSLDVLALQAVFEGVTALHWHAQDVGPDDEDGPHLSLEGTYQGHPVWLRVLAEAPDDEEPGLELDTSASP